MLLLLLLLLATMLGVEARRMTGLRISDAKVLHDEREEPYHHQQEAVQLRLRDWTV